MPSTNHGKSGKILKFFSKDAQLNTEQSQRKCATVHSRCLLVQYKQYWKEIRSYVALCSLVCYSVIECQREARWRFQAGVGSKFPRSKLWSQSTDDAAERTTTTRKKQLREWKQVIRRTDLIIWVLNAQGNVTTLPYFTHHTSDDTKHEMQTCASMKYILTGSHLLFLLITPQGGHASIKKHWQMTKQPAGV